MDADNKQSTVLVIAGYDPSAGAGILADIKTISAFGCYGIAAVTSLTLQNTQGVYGVYNQSEEVVRGQLSPLFDDFEIAAIKTGMLPTSEVIKEVARSISSVPARPVVIDPVVRSTSGYDLIDDVALRALIGLLFPLASVVTPNAAEVERITGLRIKDRQTMEQAAKEILALGPQAVLIKGGDMTSDTADDLLLESTGTVIFSTERIQSKNTHGTGCTLASAIACLLALGYPLREALPVAKRYVYEAIRTAPGLGKGHGPLNHFPPEY